MSKELHQVKRDYLYILEPILHMEDKEDALKRLTTLEKRVEESIWIKEAKLEIIREMKKKLNFEILGNKDI